MDTFDDFLEWTPKDWRDFDKDPIDSKIGRAIGDLFAELQKEVDARDDNDYEFNREQGLKLFEAYEFFASKAKEHNGTIDPINLRPHEEVGYLNCSFPVFYLSTVDEKLRFGKILLNTSGFSIDATLDGITHFSMTFPDVFVRKHK